MRKGISCSEAGKLGHKKSKCKREEHYKIIRGGYDRSPTLCKECGKELPYEKRKNKFCNSSCSATHINKRRKRKDARLIRQCKYCGKKTKNPKYCNRKCSHDYKRKIIDSDILKSGEVNYGARTAKRYLIENIGVECSVCGLKKWQGNPVPLVLDHIDGNSENNRLDNLRLVCGNCDMQLPTYKNKNKGNGRAYRRQRYKDGKSF